MRQCQIKFLTHYVDADNPQGFNEFLNLVIDDTFEVTIEKEMARQREMRNFGFGRCLSKGDNMLVRQIQ